MTGRKAGYCAGNERAGLQNPGLGRLGRAFRRGRGFHGSPRGFSLGRKYRSGAIPASREALQIQREVLRDQLEATEKELAALETEGKK